MSAGFVTAYVGIGSNQGNARANLVTALREMAALPGLRLEAVSALYLTEPELLADQPFFLNAVVRLLCSADLLPLDLLQALQGIENRLGRVRSGPRYGPRPLDLDLLLFGETVMQGADLSLPHPRLVERAFVLVPLGDIAPDLVLPGSRTVRQALGDLGEAVNPARIRRLEGPEWGDASSLRGGR